jgi:hypothetical protein
MGKISGVKANFEILPYPTNNVDLFIAPAWAYVPTPDQYFYASTNPTNSPESIVVTTSSGTHPLTPGDWLIAVVNRTDLPANYVLRITETLGGVVNLTNGVPFTNTGGNSVAATPVIDYYAFNISTNAVRAQFEILAPSDNVDLIVHHGAPLPTLDNFDYQSANTATNSELVALVKNRNLLCRQRRLG